MNESKCNDLEISILQWIADRTADPALRSQINTVIVIKREYTGTGWFIDLTVPDPVTPIDPTLNSPILGPCIRSPQIEADGESLLFHENGIIKQLEMYSRGGHFGEKLSEYKLYGYEDYFNL